MADDVTEAVPRLRHNDDSTARPNARSYTMVIGALWDAKRGDEAVKLFNEMADMNVVPNDRTCTVMIRGDVDT
jgi:pentatricopeptide repeat protein